MFTYRLIVGGSIVVAGLASASPARAQEVSSGAASPSSTIAGAMVTAADRPSAVATSSDTRRERPSRGYDIDIQALKARAASRQPSEAAEPLRNDAGRVLVEAAGAGIEQPRTPSLSTNFRGIGPTGFIPGDPHIAAGPSHLIQIVNSDFRIASKSGTTVVDWFLEDWFANVTDTSGNRFPFDPQVFYDDFADRWVMLAVNRDATTSVAYYLLSVSLTSDAAGSWCNWALRADQNGSTPSGNLADYPKLGLDNTNFYITSNQFSFSTNAFAYAKLRIMKKSQFHTPSNAAVCNTVEGWYDFWSFSDAPATLQPAHNLFTSPDREYIVNSGSGSGTSLTLRSVTGTWPNSTNTPPVVSSTTALSVTAYELPPDAAASGSTTLVDTIDARLMNAVYANGFLYTAQTVGVPCTGSPSASCVRFYKINVSTNAVSQFSIGGGANTYVYYPAVTVDGGGNIYLVYSYSTPTRFIEARYIAWLTTDSGTISDATLKAGEAAYTSLDSSGRNRWGDYGGIAVDPSDGAIWMFHQYASPSANNWRTWVGRSTTPHLSISDITVIEGDSGTSTATFTISLDASNDTAITVNYNTRDDTATSGSKANTTAITVPGSGTSGSASPYPSTIAVPAGLGTITKATAVVWGISHTFPRDIDVLLVGPAGQTVLLMSDVGSGTDASNLTFTFDDTGSSLPSSGALASGTFKPTNIADGEGDDTFASPAPAGPYGSTLSGFNGTNPQGDWKLYVRDDFADDSGSVAGGWALLLTTSGGDYVPKGGTLTFSAGSTTSQTVSVTVNGDTSVESSERFYLDLTTPRNAVLGDQSQAAATLINEDFTDDPLSATVTTAKSAHITELRTLINELRARKSLAAFSFTDTLTAGSSTIKAVHINELRTALSAVYTTVGQPAPTYADSTLTAGSTAIKAVHISELRDKAVNAP